jgi:hypothetical protein
MVHQQPRRDFNFVGQGNFSCSDWSEEGTVRHHTTKYTPQQNGAAERLNITIISKAHCILSNAGMDKHFWAKDASVAC